MKKEEATMEATEEQGVKQMTEEERKEAFEAHKREREDARNKCQEEIQVLLKKYQCRLTAQITVSEFRSVPTVFLVDATNNGQ